MKYDIIVRKLHSTEGRYITSDIIKKYCAILNISYNDAITYLTRNKHLYTILKGIFYKPSVEERKFNALKASHLEAVSEALKLKGINNWYFGLETALKFNSLTHEFFTVDFILNDTIARTRPIMILGNKVLFLKIKPELFLFGIKKENGFYYSDVEKTLLDIMYIKRYKGIEDLAIIDSIKPFLKKSSLPKLKKYAPKYNKKIEAMAGQL